jgi:hypothetical protein
MILAGLLLLHLWPFSRPATLIPMAWWAMFLVNRHRVTAPVLGLIDTAAQKAGFFPVPAAPAPQGAQDPAPEARIPPRTIPPTGPAFDEDGELSAV